MRSMLKLNGQSTSPVQIKRRRIAGRVKSIGAIALIAAACLISTAAAPDDNNADRVETARATLEKWVEVRRLISLERRDWSLARELLTNRIELVHREIKSLRDKIGDAEKSIAEADTKREALIGEHERLKQASATLGEVIVALEARTRELLPRLPEPIRQRIKPLSQRLPSPADGEASNLSLSERFQNVAGILNEVNKFHGEITVATEVHPMPDGSSVEVTALYVGISQGYYIGGNGTIAGVGRSSPDEEGWVWRPANDAAPQIAQAIAILKNEQVADFVTLPIELK